MPCWLVINSIYDQLASNQKHAFTASMYEPCFTTTLVVLSHENNACTVFASQACFHTAHDQLNAKCCFHVMLLPKFLLK